MAETTSPKRICVLTSGNVRVIDPCTGILLKQLRAAGHPIDFHAMWWDDCDLDAARDALAGLDSLTFWTTPRVNFEDDLTRFPKPPETVIHNFLSMTWSRLQLRRKLVEEGVFDRYDLFLFVRLDTCFNRPLDYAAIDAQLREHDVLLPVNGHWRDGWSDQFVAGRAAAVQTWLGFADRVKGYLAEGVLLHPETLLKHHLVTSGLRPAPLITTFIWRGESTFNVG